MRLWRELARRIVGAGSNEHVTVAGIEYRPSRIASRTDVPGVLGLTEREFVEAILIENGCRIRQRAFTDYTDWSVSHVREVLAELEADGAIVRVSAGRETVVLLPPPEAPPRRNRRPLV